MSTSGVTMIAEERARVLASGKTIDADIRYTDDELEWAARTYILGALHLGHGIHNLGKTPGTEYPWKPKSYKASSKIDALVKAGQLIAAAIDRELVLQEEDDDGPEDAA